MNFFFILRLLAYVMIIVGCVLLTHNNWSVYYSYLHSVDPEIAEMWKESTSDCSQKAENGWLPWTPCNHSTEVHLRNRTDPACNIIIDTKPCHCPVNETCEGNIFYLPENDVNSQCLSEMQNSLKSRRQSYFFVDIVSDFPCCNLPCYRNQTESFTDLLME